MYRFETRAGYPTTGLHTLSSWTSWSSIVKSYNSTTANVWHHASVVIGSNTTSLYIDGALVSEPYTYTTMPSSTDNTYFGFIGDGMNNSNHSSQFKKFSIVWKKRKNTKKNIY